MKNQIIVDSCCDLTVEMKNEMSIISVPLTMMLGDKEFRDDESLNINEFMLLVKQFSGKVGSASPAPYLYQNAIESAENAYVITLSGKLSSSYSNAVIGNNEAMENGSASAYLFDSKSASAGETLIAIKLYELITADMPRERIAETLHRFIDGMKTYFVLDNYDNLQRNGRLSSITGTLIQMLNIKLIMGSDGNGDIALFKKCNGVKYMIEQLLSFVGSSGREMQDENLVISHCNNPGLAQQLRMRIAERFNFKRIYVVPTSGLSSLYTNDKGVVLAF